MQLTDHLYTLFQAPFEDADVTAIQLAAGYSKIFQELMAFAAQNAAIDATTQDLLERQASADIFVTSCMGACFAALAEAMAAKAQGGDYKTSESALADMTTLSDAWAEICANSLDPEVRAQLMELFTRASEILQNLSITLPKVGTFKVPSVPASVLSYMLYDTDAQTEQLVALNQDLSPFLYDGDANILTQQ